MEIITNHNGVPAKHGRVFVNGVRFHYSVMSEDEPLFLPHGVPRISYHWRRVILLLTPCYTVVAPDLRGFGDLERPPDGFNMENVAEDIAQLATHLRYEEFLTAGEDWGATAAYQLTAQYPERVKKLIFQEMALPGFGLEDYSFLTRESVSTYVWLQHIDFYSVPSFLEVLIAGRERKYFNYSMKRGTHNPQAITPDALDEYVRCYFVPGGIRGMREVYRAALNDVDQNREATKTKLKMPILAVSSECFIGADNEQQMREFTEDVSAVILP